MSPNIASFTPTHGTISVVIFYCPKWNRLEICVFTLMDTTKTKWYIFCCLCISVPYTWDEPTMEPLMTMYAQGGSKTTYDLDKLEEGEQLCYENFIFLAATSTFGRFD